MAFQFPWTNFHELNLDWFLSKFKQFTDNYLGTTATVELIPDTEQPEVTVTGGTLDDDTDIVDPFTFNFKLPINSSGGGAVDSVNGKVGDVVLDKSDIGLGNVDNVQQYSATNPPPYPVTSVNGDTGAVVLDKTDIGLGNVANVAQYSASNPPPYPVTSVNGQTGDVTVTPASDAQVTTAVNTWLGNNVAQETGYVLDRTLSMSNAGAPADLVGGLKDAVSTGISETFTIPNSNTYIFPTTLIADVVYTYTNNTSAAQSLNLYKADGTRTAITGQLLAGASINFTPDSNDYVSVGGWFNAPGTASLTSETLNMSNGVKADKAFPIVASLRRLIIDIVNRTISFKYAFYINTAYGRYQILASDVVTQITSTYGSYDLGTDTATITLPNEYTLVFRISDAKLHVVNRNNVLLDDVILYGEYYQNNYGLLWEKYWLDLWQDSYAPNLVTSDEIFNAEPSSGTYDWQTPVVSYGALFKGASKVESFAFFTDPHVAGFADNNRNESKMQNYCKRIQKVINSTPCGFTVCGGDWLNNSTTMNEACYRLGLIKGISDHLLSGCKLVIGNHDTNYQGKLDSASANYTGTLTDATIASIMFRDTETKKAYYSFNGCIAKCYVLDSGIEHNTMLPYDWEQVEWLATKLIQDDPEHGIIFIHIITHNGSIQTNTSNFASLVQAYNSHSTVTLNNISYNFSNCTGHIDFWMGGHTHTDSTGTLGGIPYLITASNDYTSDVPLIDLVLVDYDNNALKTIRVGGTGSNRTITI